MASEGVWAITVAIEQQKTATVNKFFIDNQVKW